MVNFVSPDWKAYELLDSGGFEKLERFGEYILARPEPQAFWQKGLPENEWGARTHARFEKLRSSPEKGKWQLKKGMPDQWWVEFPLGKANLKLRLALTSFKHVGVFPEQADNWRYIYNAVHNQNGKHPVLNLFAYTGAASLAARAAGATVIHLDSVKQVVTWARGNMEESNLDGISWVVEDALKFTRREANRGRRYQGIILDPPAYGRGPKGEKWILEDLLPQLLDYCSRLLDTNHGWLVLNLYSMGLSALVADSILASFFQCQPESGELFFQDRSGRKLPLGIFSRFSMKA